jgi:hypothetical protein
MPRFGKLIFQINKRQIQQGYPPVFFLAENTALRNDRDQPLPHGDLEIIKREFNIGWDLVFDSRNVSPIRRKRTYLSNIPLQLQTDDLCDPSPIVCLDDGFDIAGHIVEPQMIAKAQGLMASSGRIDDDRMKVYRKSVDGRFKERTISVVEREVSPPSIRLVIVSCVG